MFNLFNSQSLRNKKFFKLIGILTISLLGTIITFWCFSGTILTTRDFQILDHFYRLMIKTGSELPISPRIVYLNITGDTFHYFDKNILDRADLARVNIALAQLGTAAVAYDIIFARPGNRESDSLFSASLRLPGNVYLPIGFDLSDKPRPFTWENGAAYERLQTEYLVKPVQKSTGKPLSAIRAVMQADDFSRVAVNSGHISAVNDADGIYRHAAMLVKVDSLYFPALALAMFLDYVNIPFEKIVIDWGHHIIIPALPTGFLDDAIIIPIDQQGRTFIPYPQTWQHDFDHMTVHEMLKLMEHKELPASLLEFFEGNFVFIGDVSIGVADLGQTPLEDNVPLIVTHTAILNGLITNTFFEKWPFRHGIYLICGITLLLGLTACIRYLWIMYGTGLAIIIGIVGYTWYSIINLTLFPIFSIGASLLFIFIGLVFGMQIVIAKEQAFIRTAFSRYVSETVVNQLVENPQKLKLGGEERDLTVLFSDIKSFTSISESLPAQDLVKLLNEYLSEMTAIIQAQDGTIDKYQGDAIMAEFGAPVELPNHADKAVMAALDMQQRLAELRQHWRQNNVPELWCRIGINTGLMVVGNMGSDRVFDYTVMGDAVNLAARLESANKRYDTAIMISEFTRSRLTPGLFRTRLLDVITVKGKTRAIKVFEVYGKTSDPIDQGDLFYYDTYHRAMTAYLSRNFTVAHEQFTAALSFRPGDPAAKELRARVDSLDPGELPGDWDGSVQLETK